MKTATEQHHFYYRGTGQYQAEPVVQGQQDEGQPGYTLISE